MDNLLKQLFSRPGIILISSDVNCGKSMLLYHLITLLKEQTNSKIYSFGLRRKVVEEIHSVQELEELRDSICFADEFCSLFDLDDRKNKKLVEQALRLINHNNNIIILSGIPNNFKRFICGKANIIIYKKNTLADFINGSRIKNVCLAFKGYELGSAVLDIPIDKALIWDGKYKFITVPYYKKFDTKRKNKVIMLAKSIKTEKTFQKKWKKREKTVPKKVEIKNGVYPMIISNKKEVEDEI